MKQYWLLTPIEAETPEQAIMLRASISTYLTSNFGYAGLAHSPARITGDTSMVEMSNIDLTTLPDNVDLLSL